MSRILLVDDSPHAQRMGERILSEEGYEVVTVSNADSALIRLEDFDPDLLIADAVMPGRTGFEICQYVKMSPRHRHMRVILTAGASEPFDESQAQRAQADTSLRKPFEATALLETVKPLAEAAVAERPTATQRQSAESPQSGMAAPVGPFVAVVDAEQIQAAVTIALDASMSAMVEEITKRVLVVLTAKRPDSRTVEASAAQATPAAAVADVPAADAASLVAAPRVARTPASDAASPVTAVPPAVTAQPEPSSPPGAPLRGDSASLASPPRPRAGSVLGLD
jgi:CheY-like chemotaxis protein